MGAVHQLLLELGKEEAKRTEIKACAGSRGSLPGF